MWNSECTELARNAVSEKPDQSFRFGADLWNSECTKVARNVVSEKLSIRAFDSAPDPWNFSMQ
jgi:hypothetical protein